MPCRHTENGGAGSGTLTFGTKCKSRVSSMATAPETFRRGKKAIVYLT